MSKTKMCGVEELLALFEETLQPEDVLEAKIMAQVSSAITGERLEMGMTQTEFADFLGVSQSQVSKWESEGYNFSLKSIAKIAARLDMRLDFQMTRQKGMCVSNEKIRRISEHRATSAAACGTYSKINTWKGGRHYASVC